MRRIGISKRSARVGLVGLVAIVALAALALAYFSSTGTGKASATVGLLRAPTITSATAGAGTVTLNWSTVTPPSGAGSVTYYISRNGGTPSSACPTSSTPSGVRTCTDTGLAKGTYSYTVTAIWQSWTATSAPATRVAVSSGPVSQLVFTTQPDGGATGGSAFPTQPVVAAEDAGGNIVTGYTTIITLSIATGTTGATLSGCTGTLSKGVTSFSGCKIDNVGTYTLTASNGKLAKTSASFTVSLGPLSQLVFTTQPDGGATGGLAFPTQPVVTPEDAGGNTVTSYTKIIQLSIETGRTGAILSGCTGTLRKGVTSFSGCEIDRAGTYTLTASDGTLSAPSAQLTVLVGPAAQLVFTTQPDGDATGGNAFPTQPVLAAQDAGGNTVITNEGTVQLSIATGPTGAILSGCTAALRKGVTSFSRCEIDKAGTYTLTASDGNLTKTSASFTVSIGPVSELVFTTQPDGVAVAGSPVPTQPVVTAQDAGGNTVTSYAGTISLSIKTGTGVSGATLSGCTATRSNGVTSFNGCTIDKVGSAYQLIATDGTQSAASTAFDVSGRVAVSVLEQDTPTTASNTFTAGNNISTDNGVPYLMVIYGYGSPSCAFGQTDPAISGPFTNSGSLIPSSALTVVSTKDPSGGSTKSCIEVVQETGNGASAPVKVTLGHTEDVAFVDVLKLSGGTVQGTPNGNTTGSTTVSSTATAAFLTAPASTHAEIALVGLTGNAGNDSITAPAGMTQLGNYQQSSILSGGTPALDGNLGIYFNPVAQTSTDFALKSLAVNWGTIAIQIGQPPAL